MSNSRSCNKKYKHACVQTKGAFVILVISIARNTMTIITGGLSTNFIDNYSYIIFAVIGLHYLFYPLLGLLGEKWMRYKVIMFGIILMFVGFFIALSTLVILYFIHIDNIAVVGICLVLSFPYFFGYGIFESNMIQFGTDQLQFAPSQELSSFVYWVLYMNYFSVALLLLITSIITGFIYKNTIYFTFTFIFGSGVLIIIIAVLSFFCFKHHLVLEQAQHNNPVKLIWKVMKYAWTHRQPMRRSAFTYGEPPPSRLDLGKERFGGPFTTVEVEDVKSFLYILSIVLGTLSYGFLDNKNNIYNQYVAVVHETGVYSFMENMLLIYPLTIPYLVIVFAVPIHQFVIVPLFPRCIPSMLKRIWIGLVALLIELATLAMISYMINKDIRLPLITDDVCLDLTNNGSYQNGFELTFPFYIMAVPQFFSGISIFLVHFTIFEFILAQGPRTMQGLLLGIWFMHFSIYCVQITLSSSWLGCYWEYYAVKTGVVFIFVICYTIAAHKYKYRQRNEQSDVNERVIITEYTERQLEHDCGIDSELCQDDESVVLTYST